MNTDSTHLGFGDTTAVGQVLPFEKINVPGTYVCNWSGHLLRVPPDAVTAGRSPLMNLVGTEALMVTRIADDPYVPLTKARLLAANCDIAINF